MNSTLKIVHPAAPPDAYTALRNERAEVIAALQEVDRKLARLAEADRIERETFAEIGALGDQEIEAVKDWVASGCEGPQPEPDAAARRALSERLANAVAAQEAAKGAAAEVNAAGAALRARLADVDTQLRIAALGELSATFADLADEWGSRAGSIRAARADLYALPTAIFEAGRAIFDLGGEGAVDRATELYRVAEALRAKPIADAEPTKEDLDRALAKWSARIHAIISGT